MVLLKRQAQIVAKVESTSGTAETSFAAANLIVNAFDPVFTTVWEQVDRMQLNGFGRFADMVGTRSATATFRVELTGDESGTSPVWAETLLPACGMKQTGDAFTTNAVMTMGSWAPCVATMGIDIGNAVILRECQSGTDGSGYAAALVTDRTTIITVNPEAVLVATNDTYAQALAGTETAFSCVLDDTVDVITIAAGAVAKVSPQSGDRNGVVTDDFTLKVLNDSFSITWSAS